MEETSMVEKKGIEMEGSSTYEASFHLLPTLSKEKVDSFVNGVLEYITNNGGSVISQSKVDPFVLAYSVSKSIKSVKTTYDRSYFGWIVFSLSSESVVALKEMLQTSDSVLRFLLIHTSVEEDVDEDEDGDEDKTEKKTKKASTGEKEIVSEEELDKTIDQLVIN